ncbi:MAG: hypothetical protein J2P36_16485 [Ktedonobacteraceae bacterium]|nr:hypothetical protein [Ktedonobacteraceae bacterium]
MALFHDRIMREITELVWRRYRELGEALGVPCERGSVGQLREQSGVLQEDLKLLIGVANGEYQRTDELVRRVEQALARLMELLLGNVLRSKAVVPEGFWKTEIGILISRTRWWISVDDLITISNAAALAFGENTQANRMRIVRAIDSGLLEWIPDPSVANPQQNKRVLRPQVERLRDQRRLPEAE